MVRIHLYRRALTETYATLSRCNVSTEWGYQPPSIAQTAQRLDIWLGGKSGSRL